MATHGGANIDMPCVLLPSLAQILQFRKSIFQIRYYLPRGSRLFMGCRNPAVKVPPAVPVPGIYLRTTSGSEFRIRLGLDYGLEPPA